MMQTYIKGNAAKKLDFLSKQLADGAFFHSATPTIVDFYLYIVLSWTGYVGLTLEPYPVVKAYFERVAALDGVKSAHALIAQAPASTV